MTPLKVNLSYPMKQERSGYFFILKVRCLGFEDIAKKMYFKNASDRVKGKLPGYQIESLYAALDCPSASLPLVSAAMAAVTSEDISQRSSDVKTEYNEDEELTLGDEQISLKCPISMTRITHPARGSKCTHASCFDLEVSTLTKLISSIVGVSHESAKTRPFEVRLL